MGWTMVYDNTPKWCCARCGCTPEDVKEYGWECTAYGQHYYEHLMIWWDPNEKEDKVSETTTDDWLTQKQVCEMLHISMGTLMNWRHKGKIEVSYPLGKPDDIHARVVIRISRAAVQQLMNSGVVKEIPQ